MRFLSFLHEEYLDLVTDHLMKKSYAVYKNPTNAELRTLYQEAGGLIRFVLTPKDLFISDMALLHVMVIKKYNLRNEWWFRGIGRIEGNKIVISDLRTGDHNYSKSKYENPVWQRYFRDWELELQRVEIDASIL